MSFHTSQDARIHYRLDGHPHLPLLILGNSLGTDLFMWEPQMNALMARFRVLRFDTLGHGASQVLPGDTSIERLARDVLGLADLLRAERFAFCGLSLGAMVGQWLGIHAPERLEKLVLSNASPYLPSHESWSARMALARREGMGGLLEMVMPRFFSQDYRDRDAAFYHSMRTSFASMEAEGYAACCAAVRDADFRPGLQGIRTPTLVIAGALDTATPAAEHAQPLHRAIPEARWALLRAGHIANVEQPEAFNRALLDFL